MHKTLSQEDVMKVHAVATMIEKDIRYHCSIDILAGKVLMNRTKLLAAFNRVFGMPPHAYRINKRIETAKRMLMQDMAVRSIARQVGFTGDQAENNFIKCFKKEEGIPPATWKRLHQATRPCKEVSTQMIPITLKANNSNFVRSQYVSCKME